MNFHLIWWFLGLAYLRWLDYLGFVGFAKAAVSSPTLCSPSAHPGPQKRPYLYKDTAPAALNPCIQILSWQRIFLAMMWNCLIYWVCTAKAIDTLGLQSRNKILNLGTRNKGARGGREEGGSRAWAKGLRKSLRNVTMLAYLICI